MLWWWLLLGEGALFWFGAVEDLTGKKDLSELRSRWKGVNQLGLSKQKDSKGKDLEARTNSVYLRNSKDSMTGGPGEESDGKK